MVARTRSVREVAGAVWEVYGRRLLHPNKSSVFSAIWLYLVICT